MKKKQSFLQKRTIERIENFCGIKELTKYLNRLKNNQTPINKLHILTTIQYYESLYLYYVSVEDDFIDYKENAMDTVKFLNEQNLLKDCQYLCFLVDLINDGLEYTSKIRRLA